MAGRSLRSHGGSPILPLVYSARGRTTHRGDAKEGLNLTTADEDICAVIWELHDSMLVCEKSRRGRVDRCHEEWGGGVVRSLR